MLLAAQQALHFLGLELCVTLFLRRRSTLFLRLLLSHHSQSRRLGVRLRGRRLVGVDLLEGSAHKLIAKVYLREHHGRKDV